MALTHQLEIAVSCPIHKSEAGTLLLEGEWIMSDFTNWKGQHSCAGAAGTSTASLHLSMSHAWMWLLQGGVTTALFCNGDISRSMCGQRGWETPSTAHAVPTGTSPASLLCQGEESASNQWQLKYPWRLDDRFIPVGKLGKQGNYIENWD